MTRLDADNARLSRENERLKMKVEIVEVLREEKTDLEKKLVVMEGLRTKVAELEGEVVELRRKEAERYARFQRLMRMACTIRISA